MDAHRLVLSTNIEVLEASAPFSSFKFVEDNFNSSPALHRCCSLARSEGLQTLVVEDIQAKGAISDENKEIPEYVVEHKMTGLKRLTFWKKKFKHKIALNSKKDKDLIGYALLKRDRYILNEDPSNRFEYWHIFEAVFHKYPHKHNCVPGLKNYRLNVAGREFCVTGVLFCQQNELNKVCAHVALRSLLSRRLKSGDVLYSKINELAKVASSGGYNPIKGLNAEQIRYILNYFDIPFRDIDYFEEEKKYRKYREEIPYQKYLYSGVESGAGALLGFKLTGLDEQGDTKAEGSYHIIPFYGHTFNKDTWVPDAEKRYFQVTNNMRYIPSESWTSSFIGHDDDFGANFCVQRFYVKPEQVEYVVEFLHDGFEFSGVQAEALALHYLYSLQPQLENEDQSSIWTRRLAQAIRETQSVVLRAVACSTKKYLEHLSNIKDWESSTEDKLVPNTLERMRLPGLLWVVEVSLPQLFPANERKLGEFVLNPFVELDEKEPVDFNSFLFARLPGRYFFPIVTPSGNSDFLDIPSNIKSHTELLVL